MVAKFASPNPRHHMAPGGLWFLPALSGLLEFISGISILMVALTPLAPSRLLRANSEHVLVHFWLFHFNVAE